MPSAGFEPTIAAIEQLQAYALDRTDTEIDLISEMLLSKLFTHGRSVAYVGKCGSSSGVMLWRLVYLSEKALIRKRVTHFTEVKGACYTHLAHMNSTKTTCAHTSNNSSSSCPSQTAMRKFLHLIWCHSITSLHN